MLGARREHDAAERMMRDAGGAATGVRLFPCYGRADHVAPTSLHSSQVPK